MVFRDKRQAGDWPRLEAEIEAKAGAVTAPEIRQKKQRFQVFADSCNNYCRTFHEWIGTTSIV